jgi:hypothetical protein
MAVVRLYGARVAQAEYSNLAASSWRRGLTCPDRYRSGQTFHRRFQRWVRSGVLRSILEVLVQALDDEGYLDLQKTFIDGSFARAKQGGA